MASITQSRQSIQKVCIALGFVFLVLGLGGIFLPGLMMMHLSVAHNLIHLATGALALAAGFGGRPRSAYVFAIVCGILFGLLGVGGFMLGEPGYPGVGNLQADQSLFRLLPNVLELGTMDHAVHVLLSAAFLFGAYAWKKQTLDVNRTLVDRQRRAPDDFGSIKVPPPEILERTPRVDDHHPRA